MITEATKTPYRYIIRGVLEQQTPLSVGGNRNNTDEGFEGVDMVLAKDGKKRVTLRGTTLAGALISTARLLYGKDKLPNTITEGSPQNQDKDNPNRLQESHWIFHHAHYHHPKKNHTTDITFDKRDLVSIRQKTGAAMHGALYNVQTLPAGTKWDFLMEVDTWQKNSDVCKTAVSIALNTLKQWEKICWLGRDIARGLGWLKLNDIKVYKLENEHALIWPDSGNEPLGVLDNWNNDSSKPSSQPLTDYSELMNEYPPVNSPFHCGKIIISTGADSDECYGFDNISVVAGQAVKKEGDNKPKKYRQPEFDKNDHWLYPIGQERSKYDGSDGNDDDNTANVDCRLATWEDGTPFIPGSGLRGPLRHALSWLLRKQGIQVWEPGTDESIEKDDIVAQMFGSTEHSGLLLIRDAEITEANKKHWKVFYQEMHAEDEFTQGVFGESKFDRPALLNAEFEADYCLINPEDLSDDDFRSMCCCLDLLNTLGKNQFIGIGGGKWKGLGWVTVEITNCMREETDVQ